MNFYAARIGVWGALLLLGARLPLAAAGNTGVRVVEQKNGGEVVLIAQSEFNLEFTLTLRLTSANAIASRPVPLTVDSAGRKTFELVRLQRRNALIPWRYNYAFEWKAGARRTSQTNDAVYLLPYSSKETHRVIQASLGKFSHYAGSQDEHAVDWEAATGTVVCAARDGVVTGVRQDSGAGGPDVNLKGEANYVIIKHADGTFAEYYHLKQNGAQVRLGQSVVAGDPIALSGSTGFCRQPHIHFAVFQTVTGSSRITLPVRFKTPDGAVTNLVEGMVY